MAWARVNNIGTFENPSYSATATLSCTTTTTTNGLLIVGVGMWDSGDTVTGITFNGQALTKAVETANVTWKSNIWYLTNPPVTTADVVVTFGGGDTFVLGMVMGVSLYSGIDQVTPVRASTASVFTDTSTIQNPYVDVVNCVADDLVYGVCLRNGASLTSADTSDWNQYNNADNEIGAADYKNGSTGTVRLNWTSSAIQQWACCGVAFTPASTVIATRKTLLGVGV